MNNDTPNQSQPVPADPSKAIYDEAKQRNQQFAAQKKQKLTDAKAASNDKQLFDITTFAKLYDVSDDQGVTNITPALVQKYEMEYYLNHPEIKTLQAFADYRKRMDEDEAN